jgi:hypothetical protein
MGQNDRMAEAKPADVLDALARDVRLRAFLRAGKIDAMPAKHTRRRQLLAEVAQVFEPGVRYPERHVNDLLGALYPDYVALRRYLVDEDFLSRAGGEYWRTGGPVSS